MMINSASYQHRYQSRWKRTLPCLCIGLILLLTGCSSIQPPFSHSSAATSNTPLRSPQTLKQWTAKGSIIIITPSESTHARFNWEQIGQNYTIDFFGPLGTYHHQLYGKPGSVLLIDQQNHTTSATSPEALLQKTVGWDLPVQNLYYWIRGIPKTVPGWQVDYQDYQEVNDYRLPKQLTLYHQDLKIKIKVTSWQIF